MPVDEIIGGALVVIVCLTLIYIAVAHKSEDMW
jgi:hypothetical protein